MSSPPLGKLMSAAASRGIVIPAFNVPYLPMMAAISDALSDCDTYGLIEVARLEITKFEARSLAAVADEFERVADLRVAGLHLDHTPVIDEDGLSVDWKSMISEAVSLGFHSVMVDASRLPLDENIDVTSEVVGIAHPAGVMVEAELGSVLGHEAGPLPPYEELFASKSGFTDPDEAREFVEKTGVDWLSVSVGTIHGAISGAAKDKAKVAARLDIDHLRVLRDVCGIPLVLHGGSGVQIEYVHKAVKNGIAKINIATEIRQPYERTLASGGSVKDAQTAVSEVIKHLISDVYHVQESASRLRQIVGEQS